MTKILLMTLIFWKSVFCELFLKSKWTTTADEAAYVHVIAITHLPSSMWATLPSDHKSIELF
jgi:hypothetical protein